MRTAYLLVDVDRHRDDAFEVHENLELAIKEAERRLAEARRRQPDHPVDLELTDSMRRNGWRFYAKLGEEGPTFIIREVRRVP